MMQTEPIRVPSKNLMYSVGKRGSESEVTKVPAWRPSFQPHKENLWEKEVTAQKRAEPRSSFTAWRRPSEPGSRLLQQAAPVPAVSMTGLFLGKVVGAGPPPLVTEHSLAHSNVHQRMKRG